MGPDVVDGQFDVGILVAFARALVEGDDQRIRAPRRHGQRDDSAELLDRVAGHGGSLELGLKLEDRTVRHAEIAGKSLDRGSGVARHDQRVIAVVDRLEHLERADLAER